MTEFDDEAIDLMRELGLPSVWIYLEGNTIMVITTNAADALPLMNRAVAELTAPKDRTVN